MSMTIIKSLNRNDINESKLDKIWKVPIKIREKD